MKIFPVRKTENCIHYGRQYGQETKCFLTKKRQIKALSKFDHLQVLKLKTQKKQKALSGPLFMDGVHLPQD